VGLVVVAAWLSISGCSLGQQPPSVEAGILTRDGIGGRPLALGNALVALSEDSTSGYYNPASLGLSEGARIGGMYQSKFDPSLGISLQYASASYGLPDAGLGGALTLVRRSDSDIPTDGGAFDATETLILVSAGHDLGASIELPWEGALAVGGSIKLLTYRGYAEARAHGVGFDLGAQGRAAFDTWILSVGYRSSDILRSTIQWRGTTHEIAEVVPWGHHMGFGVIFQDWCLLLGGEFALYPAEPGLNSAHVGVEVTLFGFALRVGLSDGTPSFGVGMEILPGLSIDAAILLHPGLGQSIVASTELSF
jgi:hypothetical protein